MDFHIGAAIVNPDGDRLGKLTHVIVDPTTNEVVEIVLGESGLMGRDVIVPVGAVNTADHDEVMIQLNKEQLDKLQSFSDSNYIVPEAGALAGYPTGALIAPGMAPVGAATGIETIGLTPIVEVTEHIPEGDIDIEPGTEVWAADGKVGSVQDVLVDSQTRRVTGFVIEKGLLFKTDIPVTRDQVAEIGTDRITLKLSKAELERLEDQ